MLRKNARVIALAAIGAVMITTPIALGAGEGEPTDGGARNPSNDQRQSYTQETEIIADVATYGTRQSNKSNNGGGAIYGCRSAAGGTPASNEPCVRANNLSSGLAFEFDTGGALTGTITSRAPGDASKPFTTNATGVATGLNADRVDGQNAQDIATSAVAAANLFARVGGDAGTLGSNRGATAAARDAEGDYRIVFDRDVSACAYTATVASVENPLPGPIGAVLESGTNNTVNVRTYGGPDGPTDPGDRDFHLTVTC